LLSLITNLGTPESSIYYLGKNKYSDGQIIFSLLLYTCGASAVLILINISLYLVGMNVLFSGYDWPVLLLALFIILPQAINTQIRHFMLGKKLVTNYNMLFALDGVGMLVILVILSLTGAISVKSILWGYAVSNTLGMGVHLLLISDHIRWRDARNDIKVRVITDNLRNGIKYFSTGMGGFWASRLNIVLLGRYHSSSVVGLYSVAMTIPNLLANIPNQVGLILYPYISSTKNEDEAILFTALTIKVSVMLMIILALPFLVLGGNIVTLIFGTEYSGLGKPIAILMCAFMFEGISAILFNYFAGVGMSIYGVFQSILTISILFVVGLDLIPSLGIVGASIGKALASFISVLLYVTAFSRGGKFRKALYFNDYDRNAVKTSVAKMKIIFNRKRKYGISRP